MRILVAHSLAGAVSGAELAIADMVSKRGPSVEYVMLTPGEGKLASHYRRCGFAVWARELHTKRRRYPGLHTIQSAMFASLFRRASIQGVLCNTFAAAARVGTACRFAGIPYAIFVREYIRKTTLHEKILRSADRVFAVSQDVATYLQDLVARTKLRVIHDHIDAEPLKQRLDHHITSRKRALPFGVQTPVIGYIGRITKYKQPDLFVRSIPEVLSKEPGARFVVVGSSSEAEREFADRLATQVSELGVVDRVRFLGHRDDTMEILSELSICCIPSDREPFPRVILEAQLAGCAVIASNSGGCPEMIDDGESGLLFNATAPDSCQQLAYRMTRLLRDPEERNRMVANARHRLDVTFASNRPVLVLERELAEMVCSP
jgi:glycosyltransferase involved in cell wall biosynthesis